MPPPIRWARTSVLALTLASCSGSCGTSQAASSSDGGPLTFVHFGQALAVTLPWANGEPHVVRDRTPGAKGELVGFGWSGALTGFKSTDLGSSWTTFTGTGASGVGSVHLVCLTQDSTGRVHLLFGGVGADVTYTRLALTHDAAGAITGFGVEVHDVALPGTYNGSADVRGMLLAVPDASGVETLVFEVNDNPNPGMRIQLGRATSLTPAATTDFTGLDGTLAPTVLLATSAFDNHTHSAWIAQLGATRDLWLYWAPINTGDSSYTDPMSRVRLTTSGAHGWTAGTPTTIVAGSAGAEPQGYAIYGTAHFVWLLYFHPTDGISIDRIAADGSYTHAVVPSPDAETARWGWGVLSVADDETRIWTGFSTMSATAYPSSPRGSLAFWDGTAWTKSAEPTSGDAWGFAGSLYFNEGVVVLRLTEGGSFGVGAVQAAVARGGAKRP